MADYFADDIIENKLGIDSPYLLHEVEERMVAEATSLLLDEDFPDAPDETFFVYIHKRLFESLYDFVGKFRDVDITKPDSAIPFLSCRVSQKRVVTDI
jgi:fido (protein-threonine AMPylation protein)